MDLGGDLCLGSFFVHHFMEWVLFPKSDERLPNFVILAMLLHFRMLLGLFGIVLGNRLSAWVALVCAGGFFWGIIQGMGIWFFLVTAPPAILDLGRY